MSCRYIDRVNLYLNDDLYLEKQIGMDEYGKLSYEASVSIKGRKVGNTRKTINKEGEIISTNTYVLTTEDVSVGDKIDGEEVVDIKEVKDRWGNKVAVELYL